MGDVYNLREERDYPQGFSVNYFDSMKTWLHSQNFNTKMEGHVLKGEKRGTHVNFQPEIMVAFTPREGGAVQVSVHYYAKVKVVTGLAVGILTSGISTLFGAATFASHASDAEGFIKNLFQFLENNARAPSVMISKTGTDGSTQSAPKNAQQPYGYQSPQQSPHYPPQGYYPPQQQQGQQVPPYSPHQSPSFPPHQQVIPPSYPQGSSSSYDPQSGYYSPTQSTPSMDHSYQQPAHSTLEFTPPPVQHSQLRDQNQQNAVDALVLPFDLKALKNEELEKYLQFYKESAWKVERELMERKMNAHQ
eukprot:TRINITY_DN3117_c0_g3_i1.p1 TRINITY_DN3117_c0_g3~~TRINITY_DN3117_c0_g3_i1.p1  ORF type:complete len:304 (+),score=144.70 TRINITY_DN3117_c0_g3_i1:73-984(+)